MSTTIVKSEFDQRYFASVVTNQGKSLWDYSSKSKIMLVFLRHFGCIFCKEALHDIAKKQKEIKEKGVRIVFVHMTDFEIAQEYLENYGLGDHPHVSDPDCIIYKDFGLTKGTFSQLFGFMSWVRGAEATVFKGQTVAAKELGDGYQMPGVFMIYKEDVLREFIHKHASSKPDYHKLINFDL